MMLERRGFLTGLIIATFSGAATARAGNRVPFDTAAFEAAQAAGKPILVHVTAPWCGTCKKQKPIVAQLIGTPEFESLTVFEVDFDSQKDVLLGFGVRQQSTMIAFKGTAEVGRSVGDTKPGSIEALLRKAIG